MKYKHLMFSGHAIRRMFSRQLSKDDIVTIIDQGRVISDYPDDKPYPSCLILGFLDDMPVHVVFALDEQTQTGFVITAYIPDPEIWSEDFSTRSKKS